MDFLWYALIALFSGVVAGMGMGGGTLLLPLLTLFMHTPQHVAQGVNLTVFVPMAIIVIIIYTKQKLIDYKQGWYIALAASIVSALGAILAVEVKGKILSIIYGVFIGLIGIASLIQIIVQIVKKHKQKKNT